MPASAKGDGTAQQGGGSRGIEASFGQRRQGFSEAIVFTVGGGSMDEYGNLQDWAKRTSGGGGAGQGVGATAGAGGAASALGRKKVVYGSTELMNAGEFLDVLGRLGRESG